MGAGASASIAAAVSPASIQTLRDSFKDISAADRAKLAVALMGDEDVYKDLVPHGEEARLIESVQREWKDKEWAYLNSRKQEAEPEGAAVLCHGVSEPYQKNMSFDHSIEHCTSKLAQRRSGSQSVSPSTADHGRETKEHCGCFAEKFAPRVVEGIPVERKSAHMEKSGAVHKIESGMLAGMPGLTQNYSPAELKFMSKKESEARVAHKGPEEKGISGTSMSDFMKTVDMEDNSGISGVLNDAIDNLSTDMFNLPFSVSVALPSITDTPLIGISDGFCKLSGYSRDEIVGQNCRFLLKGVPAGEVSSDVRQEARRYCRAAHLQNLTSMAHSLLLQRNARKNGELFWNMFMLTLLPGPCKRNYIVGLQLDLGPTLPAGEFAQHSAAFWFKDHRENLLKVQRSMYGAMVAHGLGPANAESDDPEEVSHEFVGLAEDIQNWLTHCEAKCDMFQKWGTMPWVAWPNGRNYALMNGGVSLLRLEADRVMKGAVAMSIFPVSKKPGVRYFKIKIDDVCPQWGCDVHKGAILPTMGFTLVSPAEIDQNYGGLPDNVEMVPHSVILHGDGRVIRTVPDPEGVVHVARRFAKDTGSPQNAYKIKPQDTLEVIWGNGFLKMEADGELIFCVKDPVIFPPTKDPAYAIIDLCGAVSRATLVQ